MKRTLLLVAVAALAIVLIPASASAAPKFELVVGSGSGTEPFDHIHVNAKQKDGDTDGHFFFNFTELAPLHYEATCVTVTGNVARVGGFLRQGEFAGQFPALIEIRDNGEPGHGRDQHRGRFATPEEVSGPECADFGNMPPPVTITRGNYRVFGG